jgi:hypothetical protein
MAAEEAAKFSEGAARHLQLRRACYFLYLSGHTGMWSWQVRAIEFQNSGKHYL